MSYETSNVIRNMKILKEHEMSQGTGKVLRNSLKEQDNSKGTGKVLSNSKSFK